MSSKKEEPKPEPVMVTVSFTDGTPNQTIPLPVNCGPTLPNTLTVHSTPPREYVRVYGMLYTPKTK